MSDLYKICLLNDAIKGLNSFWLTIQSHLKWFTLMTELIRIYNPSLYWSQTLQWVFKLVIRKNSEIKKFFLRKQPWAAKLCLALGGKTVWLLWAAKQCYHIWAAKLCLALGGKTLWLHGAAKLCYYCIYGRQNCDLERAAKLCFK